MGSPSSLLGLILAALLWGFSRSSPNGLALSHHGKHCPPFDKGNFTLHQYQLYPENAAWDPERCVVYFCALFNGSVAEYDPYKDKFVIFNFPGITDGTDEHASGIDYNSKTGLLHIVIDSQRPFLTEGADVGGDNWLIRYEPGRRREHWRVNLTSVTRGLWGGFQDVAVDSRGNSYVIGTYPKSVLKVDNSGRHISVWYPPPTTNATVRGYTGTVALKGDMIIVVDNEGFPESEITGNSNLYRFDLTKPKGKPVLIPRTTKTRFGTGDKIHLPVAYNNKVLLVGSDYRGVDVFRSKDGKWRSAEYLGLIRSDWPIFFNRIVPGVVQIGPEKQYLIGNPFPGPLVPGTKGGNHIDFPLFDITDEIEALLRG